MGTKRLKHEIMTSFVLVTLGIVICIELIGFWWIRRDMEERAIEATAMSLRQLDNTVTSLMGNIHDISKFTIANKDVRSWLKNTEANDQDNIDSANQLSRINEAYSNLTNSKTFIASINIYGPSGQMFETAGNSIPENQALEEEFLEQIPQDGNLFISPTYFRKYYTLGRIPVISIYQRLRDINDFTSQLGLLRMDISEPVLNSLYENVAFGQSSDIFIVNHAGIILSHDHKEDLGKSLSAVGLEGVAMEAKEGYDMIREKGEKMLMTYYASGELDMIFVSKVPYEQLMSKINLTRNMTVLMTLITAAIIVFVFYILSTRISTPINRLLDGMKALESGDFDKKLDIERNDEIGQLADGYNQMVTRLKALIHENYVIQIKKKEAELTALQSQINPHFLYNTLDIAYWSSRMEDAHNTEQILSNLSTLFKLGLNKGKEFTTIDKEIEHLTSYINIQMLRFEDEPQIIMDIEPSIRQDSVLKLLLQPIVENALLHGIDEMEEEGEIQISGKREGDDLVFHIRDNGKGMDEQTVRRLQSDEKEEGYGLRNVHERIQLYYGSQYGLTIVSELEVGTTVTIRIPERR